jgi:hypothetical protein
MPSPLEQRVQHLEKLVAELLARTSKIPLRGAGGGGGSGSNVPTNQYIQRIFVAADLTAVDALPESPGHASLEFRTGDFAYTTDDDERYERTTAAEWRTMDPVWHNFVPS